MGNWAENPVFPYLNIQIVATPTHHPCDIDGSQNGTETLSSKLWNMAFIKSEPRETQCLGQTIKFIRNLQDIYPQDIKKSFKSLLEKLKVYENHPFERRAFLYLDIISWLESKVENKPVDQVIREKFLQENQ